MSDPSYRLLQIFNRPLGGGGEELATQEIARILSQDPGFAEAIFQSAEWPGRFLKWTPTRKCAGKWAPTAAPDSPPTRGKKSGKKGSSKLLITP
jgi:hypothetical protein